MVENSIETEPEPIADEKEKERRPKDSNELLNIFMIIIGGIYIFQGIVYYVELYLPGTFHFLPQFIWDNILAGEEGVAAFKNLLGDNAMIRTVLGAFCLIAGIGMFKEEEWAWGMSIILLSVILVTTGGAVITSFATLNLNFLSWPFWIQLISVSFAALGLLWLFATRSRYS